MALDVRRCCGGQAACFYCGACGAGRELLHFADVEAVYVLITGNAAAVLWQQRGRDTLACAVGSEGDGSQVLCDGLWYPCYANQSELRQRGSSML